MWGLFTFPLICGHILQYYTVFSPQSKQILIKVNNPKWRRFDYGCLMCIDVNFEGRKYRSWESPYRLFSDHFASFIPPSIMIQIVLWMKTTKKLLCEHPKFHSGANLKSIEKFKCRGVPQTNALDFRDWSCTLIFGSAADPPRFQGKNITFEKYIEIEAVCLTILYKRTLYPKKYKKIKILQRDLLCLRPPRSQDGRLFISWAGTPWCQHGKQPMAWVPQRQGLGSER